jgi:hypothetical protein
MSRSGMRNLKIEIRNISGQSEIYRIVLVTSQASIESVIALSLRFLRKNFIRREVLEEVLEAF